jgi:hypothetical protein
MTATLPQSKCARCNGHDDLVRGDGPTVVCNACIELLGNVVARPWECSERLLGTLLEIHADAVRLARTATAPYELVWEWTGG